MKKIIIDIYKRNDCQRYMFKLFQEIYRKYEIESYIFLYGKYFVFKRKIGGIHYFTYNNIGEIISYLLGKDFQVLFCLITDQVIVRELFKISRSLHIPYTENILSLLNKTIPRKIQQESEVNSLKFREMKVKDFLEGNFNFPYPYVIKPISGGGSLGVYLINNHIEFCKKKDLIRKSFNIIKNYEIPTDKLLLEEYIVGNIYEVNCYFSEKGEISFTYPVKQGNMNLIGVNNFSCIYNCIYPGMLKHKELQTLYKFILKLTKAMNFKNIILHIECIFHSGKINMIEINFRPGYGHLEVIHQTTGVNIYNFLFNTDSNSISINNDFSTGCYIFYINPVKTGRIEGFNKELEKKIKKLASVYDMCFYKKMRGYYHDTKLHTTHTVGWIKLKSNNIPKLIKDKEFIMKKYPKILSII